MEFQDSYWVIFSNTSHIVVGPLAATLEPDMYRIRDGTTVEGGQDLDRKAREYRELSVDKILGSGKRQKGC
jgi:hypothetical protein